MAFCITFGTQAFTKQLKGYEHVTAQCHNCGNWSAHCITNWEWFTVCFVPLIPLSTHKYKEVACPICHFKQDISTRPDIQAQGHPPGQPPPQEHQMQPYQNGPPGAGPPPGQSDVGYK